MTLSPSLIKALQSLLNDDTIAASALRRDMFQLLTDEQLITIIAHGTRRQIKTTNAQALKQYLQSNFEELRGIEKDSFCYANTRAEQAAQSGNSKMHQERSCPGFMVNSYEPIPARLNGKEIVIEPTEGTMLFVADWQAFEVVADITIVGIENMENFRLVRKQRYLFEHLGKVLFVSRYPQSTDLRQWLRQIPNQYIHFGDYDLAGMHIYETEFYKHLGARASFFVPDDIAQRLQHGSTKRYNDQYQKFKNYTPSDPRLTSLYNLIQHYHRCYDQEGYIK